MHPRSNPSGLTIFALVAFATPINLTTTQLNLLKPDKCQTRNVDSSIFNSSSVMPSFLQITGKT